MNNPKFKYQVSMFGFVWGSFSNDNTTVDHRKETNNLKSCKL